MGKGVKIKFNCKTYIFDLGKDSGKTFQSRVFLSH